MASQILGVGRRLLTCTFYLEHPRDFTFYLLYSPPNRLRRAGWRASSGWRGTRRWQKDFEAADAADLNPKLAWSTHGNGESNGAQRQRGAWASSYHPGSAGRGGAKVSCGGSKKGGGIPKSLARGSQECAAVANGTAGSGAPELWRAAGGLAGVE